MASQSVAIMRRASASAIVPWQTSRLSVIQPAQSGHVNWSTPVVKHRIDQLLEVLGAPAERVVAGEHHRHIEVAIAPGALLKVEPFLPGRVRAPSASRRRAPSWHPLPNAANEQPIALTVSTVEWT